MYYWGPSDLRTFDRGIFPPLEPSVALPSRRAAPAAFPQHPGGVDQPSLSEASLGLIHNFRTLNGLYQEPSINTLPRRQTTRSWPTKASTQGGAFLLSYPARLHPADSCLDPIQGHKAKPLHSRNEKQTMQTNFNGFCVFPNDKLNADSTILSRSCLLAASYEEVLCSTCMPGLHWVDGYFPARCNRNRNCGV